jgi:alpha-ketoglutarate-dependent taurine dioxygenase
MCEATATDMSTSRNLEAIASAAATCKTKGYAVVRLHFGSTHEIEDFAHRAGRPSSRDRGDVVWCVRPSGTVAKFSMKAGPAELHTDSTYHDDPEPFVLLYVERPASDGGESLVLHVDDLRATLDDAKVADDTKALLGAPIWRWKRPSAFGGGLTSGHAVIEDGTVRWRSDNLTIDDDHGGDQQKSAAAQLVEVLNDSAPVRTIRLDRGDALLVDNRRVLHGRRGFADQARELYRVRFWELGA